MTDAWGGYWTEAKLDVLRKYLSAFNTASRRAGATVYLDLFAGMLTNSRPDTEADYPGSSAVAMDTVPSFTKLVFWELESPARRLRVDLAKAFPDDRRFSVIAGDCNDHLAEGLAAVADLQWAPTFAFIDPKGLDVAWTTLEQLSQWRQDRKKRKVELWILLPEPALARVLGLRGVRGESSAELLTRLYGSDDWIAIHQRRRSGEFTPSQMRAEFVNLFRWRIERILSYQITHALELHNVSDQPVYTMVFATDEPVGDQIMHDVYNHAMVNEIPSMRATAVAHRRSRRESARGVPRLFDLDEPIRETGEYQHSPPWTPPSRIGTAIELDEEPSDQDEPRG